MIRLAILALRPFELWHAARVERAYRRGKFRAPHWSADQGKQAVTTKH